MDHLELAPELAEEDAPDKQTVLRAQGIVAEIKYMEVEPETALDQVHDRLLVLAVRDAFLERSWTAVGASVGAPLVHLSAGDVCELRPTCDHTPSPPHSDSAHVAG